MYTSRLKYLISHIFHEIYDNLTRKTYIDCVKSCYAIMWGIIIALTILSIVIYIPISIIIAICYIVKKCNILGYCLLAILPIPWIVAFIIYIIKKGRKLWK